jgi:integrase
VLGRTLLIKLTAQRLNSLYARKLAEGIASNTVRLVVSEMLGHALGSFTLATYGHVHAEMRKPAHDAMERMFGGVFG